LNLDILFLEYFVKLFLLSGYFHQCSLYQQIISFKDINRNFPVLRL